MDRAFSFSASRMGALPPIGFGNFLLEIQAVITLLQVYNNVSRPTREKTVLFVAGGRNSRYSRA